MNSEPDLADELYSTLEDLLDSHKWCVQKAEATLLRASQIEIDAARDKFYAVWKDKVVHSGELDPASVFYTALVEHLGSHNWSVVEKAGTILLSGGQHGLDAVLRG